MADEKTELAENRTDLAEDRTVLANERTFAGWMRTGMSAVGIGLGFHALFSRMQPDWVPRCIATAFMLVGIFIIIAAERRACAVSQRLDAHHVKRFRQINLRVIASVLSAATLALIAAIWLLPLEMPDS
jgi:putative membrane protein